MKVYVISDTVNHEYSIDSVWSTCKKAMRYCDRTNKFDYADIDEYEVDEKENKVYEAKI